MSPNSCTLLNENVALNYITLRNLSIHVRVCITIPSILHTPGPPSTLLRQFSKQRTKPYQHRRSAAVLNPIRLELIPTTTIHSTVAWYGPSRRYTYVAIQSRIRWNVVDGMLEFFRCIVNTSGVSQKILDPFCISVAILCLSPYSNNEIEESTATDWRPNHHAHAGKQHPVTPVKSAFTRCCPKCRLGAKTAFANHLQWRQHPLKCALTGSSLPNIQYLSALS